MVVIGAALEGSGGVIFEGDIRVSTDNINGYLLAQQNAWVEPVPRPISEIPPMVKGNYYGLSEHLLFDSQEREKFETLGVPPRLLRRFYGSTEVINARSRFCFWFENEPDAEVRIIGDIEARLTRGAKERAKSKDALSNGMVRRPHQFREMNCCSDHFLAIPVVSSENRDILPIDLLDREAVISNKCFALYDAPLWNMALIASRLHWVWIGTVCVRMRTDFSYSNTLGWNTFPVPKLTEQNKADLTRCAEDILLAREAHFPETIADLYDPEKMPANLRAAHERNDETLERIYIGRRFKNDTERLEKLFELYTQMTAKKPTPKKTVRPTKGGGA